MYCKNCGKVLSADDKFCSGCGTRVPERKPAGVSEPMFFLEKREPAGDKPTEKRPKRVVHLDEFQWNLDGYPTTGRKTEDVDFDWASVLDDKAKRERPKTFAPEPEKPEEPVVEMPKTVEELLAELPKVPAEESQSEPAPQDGAEEISFDRKIKAEKPVADKPEDAKSIEQLIEEMGSSKVEEPTRLISKSQIKAESVDRFYIFSKKQAEYQAMLDQEYDKIQNSLQEKNENKTASAPEVEEKKAELPVKEKKPEAAPASTTEPKAKPAPKAEPAPEAARKPELVAVIWAKPPAGILADPQPEPMAETQPKAVAETVVAETAAPETATAQDTPAAEEMPVVEKTEDAPNPVEVAAEPVAGKPVEEASGDDIPKEGQESKEGDVSRNTIIIQRIPKEEEEKEVQEEAKETKEEKEKGEDEKKDADASAITFADIFREDEEEEESEGGSRFLKVVAIILIILVILEACILGIQHFAGDSKAAQMINNAYRQVVGLFSDKDDETPVEEREGSSEMQRIIDRQSVKNENLLSISEDKRLLFEAGKDYGFKDFSSSYAFQNSTWYETEDGQTISYGDEIVGTTIQYYSALADKRNDVNEEILEYVEKTSPYYEEVDKLPENQNGAYVVGGLVFGEIRTGGEGFYVLVSVTTTDKEHPGGVTEKQIVYLKPNLNKKVMKVENIKTI